MQIKEMLEEIINNLENTRGVEASAAVSRDGLLVCSAMSRKMHADTFAAMSATMFGAAEIASKELGKGSPDRIIVEAKSGKVIATGGGSKVLLVVMTRQEADLGLILFEMKKAMGRIKEIL